MLLAGAATLGWLTGTAERSEAAFTFTMTQAGGGVIVSGQGIIDAEDLGLFDPTQGDDNFYNGSEINPQNGVLSGGSLYGGRVDQYWEVQGLSVTGPASFGTGGLLHASSDDNGDSVGFDIGNGILWIPDGIPNREWSNNMVFFNQTYASLGVTPGTYTWNFSGADGSDTIILQIQGNFSPVPAPASVLLLGAGVLGLTALRRRHGEAVHRLSITERLMSSSTPLHTPANKRQKRVIEML